MAVSINGETKTLGIVLSGGGFRAPALHLGVFTELRAVNVLDKLDLLTCVSGGSIAGGFLASNWNAPDGLERLANYLSRRTNWRARQWYACGQQLSGA
ncbi:patatin-like phospholipase family protein [Rhizobium ruizarguesonis]